MINYYGNHFFFDGKILPVTDFTDCIAGTNNRIYEVLRVVNGKPLFLSDHFIRFLSSCKESGLKSEYSFDFIKKAVESVLKINQIEVCNLRFEVLVKKKEINFICFLVPWNYPTDLAYQKGVYVGSYMIERPNPHIKQSVVNSKIRKELARHFAENDFYEILLIDHNGNITEGSRSNVFFVKGNELYSPPSTDILEGITRKKILEIASSEHIRHAEKYISLPSIKEFDACFLSGTSPKILPVFRINQQTYSLPNKLISFLMKRLNKLICEETR